MFFLRNRLIELDPLRFQQRELQPGGARWRTVWLSAAAGGAFLHSLKSCLRRFHALCSIVRERLVVGVST
jgi:hypothetical protein